MRVYARGVNRIDTEIIAIRLGQAAPPSHSHLALLPFLRNVTDYIAQQRSVCMARSMPLSQLKSKQYEYLWDRDI